MLNYNLMTPQANNFNKENPLPEYPRPYLVRDSYLNLNGIWNYEITTSPKLPSSFSGTIVVPYPIESTLSGVRRDLKKNEYLCYNRKINIPKGFIKDVVLLNFGAVNQKCDVYVNGKLAMHHDGGYLPFTVDATLFVKPGINEISLVVENEPDLNYWVGKAGKKRGGMWYTKTTGIWKTVWIESVSKTSVKNVVFSTDIHTKKVVGKIHSKGENFKLTVSFKGNVLFTKEIGKNFDFVIEDANLWDVDNPNLYDVVIENENDLVKTYFAFREFKIVDDKFYLNDKPIFINGLLDQGYFSDGIFTPASYDVFQYDILKMKELGFNTLRKHIKLEPQMFYYYCDKLGMLVLQDFPNSGKYRFIRDTVFPTIGIKKISDGKRYVSKERKLNFLTLSTELVNLLYPHPSIVYYTIFNEGWGQFHSDEFYRHFKGIDKTRVYDSTSGWFWQKESDCDSIHIYFRPVKLPKKSFRPIVLSEFGGYSWQVKNHSFNDSKVYGYKIVKSKEELTDEIIKLYERDVIGLIPHGLAGAIYTQVSDVEDETNGLLTYDRQIVKVDEERIKELMKKVKF